MDAAGRLNDLKRYLRRKWWIIREENRAVKEAQHELQIARDTIARYQQNWISAEQRNDELCKVNERLERLLRHDPAKRLLQEAESFIRQGHDGRQINRYELRTWIVEYMIYKRERNANYQSPAD